MLKFDPFVHLEETVKKAQELMENVIEQNEQWPGGGAFDKDIVKARGLLGKAQTGLVEIGKTVAQYINRSDENDLMKPVNDKFDQAYQLLSRMYNDTKKIRISLERGKSQTKGVEDLSLNLKKFNRHCKETQNYLYDILKMMNL